MRPEMAIVPMPVWKPRWRILLQDIARRHGVTVEAAIRKGKGNRKRLLVRIEMARALDAEGWTSTQIGRRLHRDHTTVLLYLGRLKKQRLKGMPNERPRP